MKTEMELVARFARRPTYGHLCRKRFRSLPQPGSNAARAQGAPVHNRLQPHAVSSTAPQRGVTHGSERTALL